MQAFSLGISNLSRLVLLLLVVLTAAAPTADAHACADRDCGSVQQPVEVVPDNGPSPCGDCGQACANGCCHAAHVATPAEPQMFACVATFGKPAPWQHATPLPPVDAASPRRPPRI